MKTRKSWREKMENPNLPRLVDIPPKWEKRFGKGVMVLPSPREVDAAMRAVRKGDVITVTELRESLARKYAVQTACPLVTGIFVRIAAEVAEEDAAAGRKKITPYWRVLQSDRSLNPKYPCGIERQEERLRDEGHQIVRGKGNRRRVAR